MIPKKIYSDPDVPESDDLPEAAKTAFRLIDQQFAQFFAAATRVSLGAIADGKKLQNLDAYWAVHTFGGVANTDETINHLLGVIPRALINVETPLFDGTAPVVGTVSFGATPPTIDQVTVRCTAASKVATFILIP